MATVTERLAQLHADLRLDYGGFWDDDANAACARTLERFSTRFGIVRLERAVSAFRSEPHRKFDAATLESYIPAGAAARAHWCADCGGSGFVRIEHAGELSEAGQTKLQELYGEGWEKIAVSGCLKPCPNRN